MNYCIGIDLGTSGIRLCAVDAKNTIIYKDSIGWSKPFEYTENRITHDPAIWLEALKTLLQRLTYNLNGRDLMAILVDGTSGSILLTDRFGTPLTPAYMYSDNACHKEAEQIAQIAPIETGAHGASSSLAKFLALHKEKIFSKAYYVLHQNDWITGYLTGVYGISDSNNALKLGYDVIEDKWPNWLKNLEINMDLLPKVLPPATPIDNISKAVSKQFSLNPHTLVATGTTDSIAGFMATGARDIGEAVTSLGSTLVIKIVSSKPVFSPEHGVYSHKLEDKWLVGGASNTGGAALKQIFSENDLNRLSEYIQPDAMMPWEYYPLVGIGERFPISDPYKQSIIKPRPKNSVIYLHALLESIARIEAQGYFLLQELGVDDIFSIRTIGGGAQNKAWQSIRERYLSAILVEAEDIDACCGAAKMALQALKKK